MGKLGRVMGVAVLLGACSSNPPPSNDEGPASAIPRAKAALRAPAQDPRFDAQGNLLPGALKLSWFPIPLAFERVPGSTDRVGNFEAVGVTADQLRRYVDAHGTPAHIEYMKFGEIFQGLAPSHTRLPLPPVDVTMLFLDANTNKLRLVVEDRTPSGEKLTPQQAMEKLAKARDRTE